MNSRSRGGPRAFSDHLAQALTNQRDGPPQLGAVGGGENLLGQGVLEQSCDVFAQLFHQSLVA